MTLVEIKDSGHKQNPSFFTKGTNFTSKLKKLFYVKFHMS